MLLETAEGIEVALGRIESAAGFDELGVDRQDFFLRASCLQCALVGCGGGNLCVSFGSLGANVGVVELKKKLSLAHMIAFFDQQAFHGCGNGSVRFEIDHRLDFPVGGDDGANGSTFDSGGADPDRALAGEDGNQHSGGNNTGSEPGPALAENNFRLHQNCHCS